MLIQNAIQTPDGTILVSRHVHDYVSHTDKNGVLYAVDGGLDYLRRQCPVHGNQLELSLHCNHSIEYISQYIIWGTRPNTSDGKVVYRFLKDLETDHLKAIAKTQKPSIWILMSIFYILNERKELYV